MKSFLAKLAVFLGIQIALAAAIFVMRPADPQRYLAASRDKHAAAERLLPSPRVLLVGGSGTAFSYDSPTMQRITGIPTANLALHIGLGPYVMLNEARDIARPGDVVVVCFEYELFRRASANETLLMELESCPERRAYLTWHEGPVILDNALVFYGTILRNTLRGLAGKSIKPVPPYSRDAINEFGDVVKHRDMPRRKFSVTTLERAERPLRQVIAALNQFDSDMRARGVRVYFAYPAVPREYFARNRKAVEHIQEQLQNTLSCPILGKPTDTLFEASDFFDTQYHMTGDAPMRRTTIVGEMLQRRLLTTADSPPAPAASEGSPAPS
jgi:hypothetical protein